MPSFRLLRPPWLLALALSVALHGAWLASFSRSPAKGPGFGAIEARSVMLPLPAAKLPDAPPPKPRPARRPAAKPSPSAEVLTSKPDVIALVRLPPAIDWLYTLRQDGSEGSARLVWAPSDDGRYRLSLTRELDGRALPGWRSEGTVEAQGLAPLRYATQRQGRDAQATNFRRDEGVISFSASRGETPLVAGVQDRISWVLQLASLAATTPLEAGQRLSLPVIGLRGEPVAWEFEVVEISAGFVHLRRAALGPYDGVIDVWLDPAHGHLPTRLSVRQADGKGFELERQRDLNDDPATNADRSNPR